jgi:hypothetical protein
MKRVEEEAGELVISATARLIFRRPNCNQKMLRVG